MLLLNISLVLYGLLSPAELRGAVLLAQSGVGGLLGLAPLLLIMVIFYVLLILPAQRRQKKTAEMQRELKNGDKVVLSSGIYGTIVGLENESVMLRIAEQVKIKVARSAIADLQPEIKES